MKNELSKKEINKQIECFNYSGYALIEDLKNEEYQNLYNFLYQEQSNFLQKNKKLLESKYFEKWPKNTLEWWSRIWEYPYIYYNISKIVSNNSNKQLSVMDFGCGVNFFPFAIANLTNELVCYDNDPLCIENLNSIISKTSLTNITTKLATDNTANFSDNNFDVIYSVSVLEHIPQLTDILRDLKRILKPDGYLLLTFDISGNKGYDLTDENFKEFWHFVESNFTLVNPYRNFHSYNLLTSTNSPIPMPTLSSYNLFKLRTKEFLNQFSSPTKEKYQLPLLNVQGIVLQNAK